MADVLKEDININVISLDVLIKLLEKRNSTLTSLALLKQIT